MSLNGLLGGALGVFGGNPYRPGFPNVFESQQRNTDSAFLQTAMKDYYRQYQPGQIIPVSSPADWQNVYNAQMAQAVERWAPHTTFTPEERWKREAEAEVLALCPTLADPIAVSEPETRWVRFLRWLLEWIPDGR